MDVDDNGKKLECRNDEFDMMEREHHKLQEKHREVLQSEYNLATAKEHLEASLRVAQDEVNKFNDQWQDDVQGLKEERGQLISRVHELQARLS